MGFSPSLTLTVNDECFYVMLRLEKVSRKNDPRHAAKSIMCVVHQWERDQDGALRFRSHQGIAMARTLLLCYRAVFSTDGDSVSSCC